MFKELLDKFNRIFRIGLTKISVGKTEKLEQVLIKSKAAPKLIARTGELLNETNSEIREIIEMNKGRIARLELLINLINEENAKLAEIITDNEELLAKISSVLPEKE